MLAGSEGTLGVITEAWVRVQPRPRAPALGGRALRRPSLAGAECVRAIVAVGAAPVQLPAARRGRGAADVGRRRLARGARARLRVDRPPGRRGDGARARDLRRARRRGRRARARRPAATMPSAPGARRSSRAPYLRDALVAMGVLSETFETAITWERFAGVPRARERRGRARRCARSAARTGSVLLPLHARLPGRPRALLHGARAARGAARRSSSGRRSSARPRTR